MMKHDDDVPFHAAAVTEATLALQNGGTSSDVRRIALETGQDPDLLLVLAENFLG